MDNYTPEQKKAIFDRNKDILVSASAGSGKTKVLVDRVLNLVKEGTPLTNMLVITFTKAAAQEMKQRIKKTLNESIQEQKQNEVNLKQQLMQVDTAAISTIDAFCLDIVRRFYYVIDLDPSFSILTDTTQAELLKERALKEVEGEYLTDNDQTFIDFYKNFSGDRDADNARELLLDLYNYAISKPDYKKWLQKLPEIYDIGSKGIIQSKIWQEQIKPYLVQEFTEIINKTKQIMTESEFDTDHLFKFKQVMTDFLALIQNYLDSLIADVDYDDQRMILKAISIPRTPAITKKKDADQDILDAHTQLKNAKNEIKDLINKSFIQFYVINSHEQEKIMHKSHEIMMAIVEAEIKLIRRFNSLKREQNLIDYSDMEQLAYQILSQDTTSSKLARDYYHKKFTNILVDEYQDTNALQDSIIQLIKNPETHGLFMVGDVKQSIYGFRQAEPALFLQKYRDYGNDDQNNERIVLGTNFRSSKPVIDNVNRMFDPLLTTDFGGIDYKDGGQLSFGANYNEPIGQATELIFHRQSDNKNELSDDEIDFNEIQMVISRIKQLKKEKFQILDPKTGEKRPFEYSDIAILTRSRTNNLNIMQEFAKNDLPLFITDAENYFQTFELTVILSYLKVIDNPDQDIPLVSVLRSPIFNFTEADLARIRIKTRNASFYEALSSYVNTNDELAERVKEFLNQLATLRNFSRTHRISELIWSVYERTNLLEIMTALPNGEQRRVNLQSLYERASSYESAGFKGLYQFIAFINRMRADQKDLAQPLLSEKAGNAVRLMTIHGSKGLEFPIVFYVGLNHKFQKTDINRDYVINPNNVGITIKTPKFKIDSLVKSMAAVIKQKQLLEEESRIVYVAVTRAKQKLILVANIKKSDTLFEKFSTELNEQGMLPFNAKIKALDPLDMIGPQLKINQNIHQELQNITMPLDESEAFIYIDYKPDEAKPVVQDEKVDQSSEDTSYIINAAKQLFEFKYSHEDSTKTTAYQSVSEIKKAFNDPDEVELENSRIIKSSNRYLQPIDTKPNFLYQTKYTGAEIGTAMHMILQYYDYQGEGTEEQLDNEIRQLIVQGRLNENIVPNLPLEEIQWFVHSDFAKPFWKNDRALHREVDFSSLIEAKTIFKDFSDPKAKILIHGTIDGYYEDSDGIILFDYKTDYIDQNHHEQAIASIKQKYSGQLHLYQQALNQMTNNRVKEKYLVLLNAHELLKL